MSNIDQSKYEEIGLIGQGVSGSVYKARDLHNEGNNVAIKKVKVAFREEDGVPSGLIREIALLKQLEMHEHPNVVR